MEPKPPRLIRRYRTITFFGIILVFSGAFWCLGGENHHVPPSHFQTLMGSEAHRPEAKVQANSSRHIPSQIWQIMLPKQLPSDKHADKQSEIALKFLKDCTSSWLALNPDYAYMLVSEQGADAFVDEHFAASPEIIETYHSISNVGSKSDFLRYLLLSVEGGVYTDTDTIGIKPIDQWVPDHLRGRVRLIVGLDFDRQNLEALGHPHWISMCQWTIAAAPNHAVFDRMIARFVRAMKELSDKQQVPMARVKLSDIDVLYSGGPVAWTEVVFELLQEYDGSLTSYQSLSMLKEPRLIGDVLVLPLDAFGSGMPHSSMANTGVLPGEALVQHLFWGSWREKPLGG